MALSLGASVSTEGGGTGPCLTIKGSFEVLFSSAMMVYVFSSGSSIWIFVFDFLTKFLYYSIDFNLSISY
jgi:hypothetical protein